MNNKDNRVTTLNTQKANKHTVLAAAISALLMAGSVAAMAAMDITAKEAEQINAELAPVANPEANAEKVGSVPEDPAAAVGTRFTYQGTLRLSGDRAQGPYDFRFKLFSQSAGGSQLGSTQTKNDLPVTDGLFATELDFGQTPIDGDDIFLQIEVRDGASTGAYTILSPRQRINATPYAVRALTGGDGGGSSPWSVLGSAVYYDGGNVGIGLTNPSSRLHVKSTGLIPMSVDGGDRAYMAFYEQGIYRGYLGSYQTGTGTTDADFEIGTGGISSTGKMHIVTQATPRITVLKDGEVGIGTTNPLAFTHIEAPSGEDPLRVRTAGTTRFRVYADGHMQFYGDVKQNQLFGGTLKAAVHITSCGGTAGTSQAIARQYNGVNSSVITATNNGSGRCIIDFPFDINNRFWSVSATNGPTGTNRAAMCDVGATNDTLSCNRFVASTGAELTGGLIVLVY